MPLEAGVGVEGGLSGEVWSELMEGVRGTCDDESIQEECGSFSDDGY